MAPGRTCAVSALLIAFAVVSIQASPPDPSRTSATVFPRACPSGTVGVGGITRGLCVIARPSTPSSSTSADCCADADDFTLIPRDTTGCSELCARSYTRAFCGTACAPNKNALTQTCDETMFELFRVCRGCAAINDNTSALISETEAYSLWRQYNGIPQLPSKNQVPTCFNFSEFASLPCDEDVPPVIVNDTTRYTRAFFAPTSTTIPPWNPTDSFTRNNGSTINVGSSSYLTFEVQISETECPNEPPVKVVIELDFIPTSPTGSPEFDLGSITLYGIDFVKDGSFWEYVPTSFEERLRFQLNPGLGNGRLEVHITAFNFNGSSSLNTFFLNVVDNTGASLGNIDVEHDQDWLVDLSTTDRTAGTVTLHGDNVVEGRGTGHWLRITELDLFTDIEFDHHVIVLRDLNLEVETFEVPDSAGTGDRYKLVLENTHLVITGKGYINDSLCICGSQGSTFELRATATTAANLTVFEGANDKQLTFCGSLDVKIDGWVAGGPGPAYLSIEPSTDPANKNGLGIVDAASLHNHGEIEFINGNILLYTTGEFVQAGTNYSNTTNSTIIIVAGVYDEQNETLVERRVGTVAEAEDYRQCSLDGRLLSVAAIPEIELCSYNNSKLNLTIGAGQALVLEENGTVCNNVTGFDLGEPELSIIAVIGELHVQAGGKVVFPEVDGKQGVLVIHRDNSDPRPGILTWSAQAIIEFTLASNVNSDKKFIPLIVCLDTSNKALCCAIVPRQNQTNDPTNRNRIICVNATDNIPEYPFANTTGYKLHTTAVPVAQPVVIGIQLASIVPPPPTQFNPSIFTSNNRYCILLDQDPAQFNSALFLSYINGDLSIAPQFVSIQTYATDSSNNGLLRVEFVCKDFSSSAQADVTCARIRDQAVLTGSQFNVDVKGRGLCGTTTNAPDRKDRSNNALFALFALALIPLLLCFIICIVIKNRGRSADNQYMQDSAAFSNVASAPQDIRYAAPVEKFYPNYPTPTGYYP